MHAVFSGSSISASQHCFNISSGIDWLMIGTLWPKYLCNQLVNARANISAINGPFDRLIS
jgi:hypothetical protein